MAEVPAANESAPKNEEVMTRKEASDFAKVCISTLKNWERQGKLPALRVSARMIRYRRTDVMKVLGLN